MRVGVIADVHGNLLALDAVLADGDAAGVDRWICLGDVVGYGPDPHLCVQRCEEREIRCLLGNHEARLLGRPTGRFNDVAEIAIVYAGEMLGADGRARIEGWEDTIEFDGEALFCHGSPRDRDEYLLFPAQIEAALHEQTTPVVFCGHTHQQFVFDGEEVWTGPGELDLRDLPRVLVNPGSVGQPRDGDVRAAYALWDREGKSLSLRRVEYDVASQAARTRRAGLPDYLAARLEIGR